MDVRSRTILCRIYVRGVYSVSPEYGALTATRDSCDNGRFSVCDDSNGCFGSGVVGGGGCSKLAVDVDGGAVFLGVCLIGSFSIVDGKSVGRVFAVEKCDKSKRE